MRLRIRMKNHLYNKHNLSLAFGIARLRQQYASGKKKATSSRDNLLKIKFKKSVLHPRHRVQLLHLIHLISFIKLLQRFIILKLHI
ncbi:hypothetical protein LX64_04914 [Chitinophaga skermanii]|uniref:Uncharacterized protein n=1 Tax=Chitinophaga skermanii TaxID=331697 RepID=A0A327Q1X1_9BACT|nr:hypothetical protein LX64_04914 [Chitinophaga skermanii]